MPRKGTKAELAAFAKQYRARYPHRMALANAKARAKREGLPFTLTENEVLTLFDTRKCVYCETPVVTHANRGGAPKNNSAALDKIDPVLGYTRDNVVLACTGCNSRKRDMLPRELRWLAERIEAVMRERDAGRRLRN
jgi:5-methylcytosine-specific restriction endonuclease McrA